MRISDIAFVLCRPAEPGNVGAICRAMRNMGLSDLRLVAPGPLDQARLLARAVHAEDIWQGARICDTLAEALSDRDFAAGATCRRGSRRKASVDPRRLAELLRDERPEGSRAAIVFGNERAGLSSEELDECDLATHIPVAPECPSLNLSHAAQIYAYELRLALGEDGRAGVKGRLVPLDRAEAGALAAQIAEGLASLGFYKIAGRREQEIFLRDLVCRAGLSLSEGRYLKDIFDKAGRLGSRKSILSEN